MLRVSGQHDVRLCRLREGCTSARMVCCSAVVLVDIPIGGTVCSMVSGWCCHGGHVQQLIQFRIFQQLGQLQQLGHTSSRDYPEASAASWCRRMVGPCNANSGETAR